MTAPSSSAWQMLVLVSSGTADMPFLAQRKMRALDQA